MTMYGNAYQTLLQNNFASDEDKLTALLQDVNDAEMRKLPGGEVERRRRLYDEAKSRIMGDTASATASAANDYNAWQQSAAPAYIGPQANRFETGLTGAEGRLKSLLDDPNAVQQSAAYKFRLGQGQEALQRQQAARGMLGSGNRLMELTKYGQDMASQEYENQFGRLSGLLGTYAGAWNQAQGTNVQEALGRFSTATQAHAARGNTLADLLARTRQTESQERTARNAASNDRFSAASRAIASQNAALAQMHSANLRYNS